MFKKENINPQDVKENVTVHWSVSLFYGMSKIPGSFNAKIFFNQQSCFKKRMIILCKQLYEFNQTQRHEQNVTQGQFLRAVLLV